MNEDDENNGLENLIIKNKDYHRKRRLKICLIIIPIIFFITIAIILIIFKPQENKIICKYIIDEENKNEKITLINIKNDVYYDLIINNKNYGKKNYFIFESYGIHSVTFDFKNKLDSLEGLFEGNKFLTYADFSGLQFDSITSAANLFKSCGNLMEVFFDNYSPNLKNLSNMFYNCHLLEKVYLNLDTSNVITMDFMFHGCREFHGLDICNFTLENVINSSSMFRNCKNLKEIKFNNNTSTKNLEDMNSMFYGCTLYTGGVPSRDDKNLGMVNIPLLKF